ncbi:MAG TPA: VTT domain-containing protein [Verrucomicrobiae bacterium]|jgi:membrane protein DedA with SNARE-associated domain|nr:VTT domain-containing protein [Verrucomicrobiae bacterium]
MTAALSLSPTAVADWVPFAKAFGFFLATFILEDVATVGAGLLLATGEISWPAAFTACFLGIWMGDFGLYALARYGGRTWFERSSLRRFATKVAESEQWFEKKGTPILIFSRVVPGARLPTFLAAGFLRVPLPRFLLITGVAACVWTISVLYLVQIFGERLSGWLGTYKHAGFLLLGGLIVLIALLQILRRTFVNFDSRRFKARLGRWTRWEFWPYWLFYPPVAIYGLWLMIKYRSITVPTASNPGIFSGGMVGESKMETLKELHATSPEFTAEAILIEGETLEARLRLLDEILARPNVSFPFIMKPDLGQRGDGIKLIRAREQAEAYLRFTAAPVLIQSYAPGPHEAGVFYYRYPSETRGHIFAITEKIFPVLIGDGKSTITELVWNDPRARFMADKYLKRFAKRKDEVLAAGEELKLVESGNHAQGCIFRDGERMATPELLARMDDISQKITGFYIGRYDIRYASEDDLRAGKNFQIIELNGASSEATNIYDARNSLFDAYRTLFKQWDLVFGIGAANCRRGCVPTKLALVWRKRMEYTRLSATYPAAD